MPILLTEIEREYNELYIYITDTSSQCECEDNIFLIIFLTCQWPMSIQQPIYYMRIALGWNEEKRLGFYRNNPIFVDK